MKSTLLWFVLAALASVFLAGTVVPVILGPDQVEPAAAAAPQDGHVVAQLLDPPPTRSGVWAPSDAELYCLACAPFLNHEICWPTESCAPGMPTLTLTAAEYAWVTQTFQEFATVQEFLRKKTWERRRSKAAPRVPRDVRRDRWRGWALHVTHDSRGGGRVDRLDVTTRDRPLRRWKGRPFRVLVIRESVAREA